MNYIELEKIKQKALEDHIPIIMDDTLEVIEKYLKNEKPTRMLEIGTAVGYSAICFSEFLAENGEIDTIERETDRVKEAKENIKRAEVDKKINIFEGDAVEILPTMNQKYDAVFIDAAKGKYPFFLKEALRMLKPTGYIFADNILYKGYVLSDYNKHKQRTAVRNLREYIKETTENPNLETEILEVGDGLAITKLNKPELLAPAGSFEKAKIAFLYGADAVYAGTSSLSLRTRADMQDDDLEKTIKYAHSIGKKVYVTLNIFAWDDKYDEIIEMAKKLEELKPDGIIAADGGVMEILKQYAPSVKINVSTQANIVSLHAANFWYKNGAKRMIMAREMNKEQLKYIMENKPKEMEVEIFVHGAICFAFSGRCFLSDFLACRSANLGDCAQSCRWSYNLYAEERNNPGEYMPIETSEYGTSIFSSKDLCLIKELPEIIDMGVDSLKIEGRLKTEYYLASVINAYRNAIDDYEKDPENYNYTKYLKELEKVKTRGLTTFYFNDRKNKDIQEYAGKQYNEQYEFGAKVVENLENNLYVVEIRNKLSVGDTLEILIPNQIEPVEFKIEKLYDIDTNEEINAISPGIKGQKVKIKLPIECKKDWIIRKKK